MLGPFTPLPAPPGPRADVQQPFALDVFRPPFGVGKVGISAVDDHMARGQKRNQLVDELVDRGTGLDHVITLGPGTKLFDAVAADKTLASGAALDELIHLFDRAGEHRHAESPAFHIQARIFLAHDSQTDQAKIAQLGSCHRSRQPSLGIPSTTLMKEKWDSHLACLWLAGSKFIPRATSRILPIRGKSIGFGPQASADTRVFLPC